MSFVLYDLIFLVLFTLAVVVFLYRRRSNLKRQGLMYLYRTRVGLTFIDIVSKRYAKILRPLQYVVVACGYVLMVSMIWFLAKFTYIYTTSTLLVRAVKIPPLIPLVPYLPNIFKVDFLPPFYFTYWIVIIAIIAVSHEFAHGIFARLNNIKVKSTGFGFLGPFLAAFVEPDEKQMNSSKKFTQLSVLAAGTFANILMTILFGLLFWLFFVSSFSAAGVNFNVYSTSVVNVSSISSINGVPFNSTYQLDTAQGLVRLETMSHVFYLIPATNLKNALDQNVSVIVAYDNAPAINANLTGPILSIAGVGTTNSDQLRTAVASHRPGETVSIVTLDANGNEKTTSVKLGNRDGKPYLGIGIAQPTREGLNGIIYRLIERVKNPAIYYAPTWGGDFAWFVYNLLWWTVLINLSVALVNMLPVGIFDGGRFFYLTIWGLTGKEKIARKAFSAATWIILAVLAWLMIRWAIAFI